MCKNPSTNEGEASADEDKKMSTTSNNTNTNDKDNSEVVKPNCSERFGDAVEGFIGGLYAKLGTWVGSRPRLTIALSLALALVCGVGLYNFTQESRPEKLWVPQGTQADDETALFETYWKSTSRFNQMIVQDTNVLDKTVLQKAMELHQQVETQIATIDGTDYTLIDVCTKAGDTCVNATAGGAICSCLITSILKTWNFDAQELENDQDILASLNQVYSPQDLDALLGNAVFDEQNQVVSAQAFAMSYFLQDRSEVKNGNEEDPINEGWEKQVFLKQAQDVKNLNVDYVSARSFSDEFGDAISGDSTLVMVSFILVFVFVGATLGRFKCGTGSRWSLAFAAMIMVGLAVVAGFGISSFASLLFTPVHNLLPFVLLGLGVDDAFVIVNAFNRERKVARSQETNQDLGNRTSRALARAGSSILVTSLTDLVAFAISATSGLPALASFGAFASICIFFLWWFASTFFTACMVHDERRQRDNRREVLCCVTRKKEAEEEEEYQEGRMSKYFRNRHAPAILSTVGKVLVLLLFAGLLSFGVYGATQLNVEDSERSFIPDGSYVNGWFDATDAYYSDQGIDLFITFEGNSNIYADRQALSELNSRVSGKSTAPPYISEPVSDQAYRNVMDGLAEYLQTSGTAAIGGATLGDDNWPTTEEDFVSTIKLYAAVSGPGSKYAQDVSFSDDDTELQAFRVRLEYVLLTKKSRGELIPDASKQIDAMDATRDMVASWDDLPPASPYSDSFLSIEGFKVIQRELFLNVGLALMCVTVIVFFTIANVSVSLLISFNVACCVIEILGFMWALGIVIDSVSVINLVLAVGLSVDYSAHVGHCFMTKAGKDKGSRVAEALADMGAAVLQGAVSTFLAVIVLLFSSSYVFEVLSRQFALTVVLGVIHGLVILPVLLALLGPKPYSKAMVVEAEMEEEPQKQEAIGATAHMAEDAEDSALEDETK